MVLTRVISAVLLWLVQLVAGAINSSNPELFCEDVLRFAFPDLCELDVSRKELTIRGLKLVYWHYRNKVSSSVMKDPVLMVHGGPAFSHKYVLPMKQQACRGRDVVFYDQVGAGESDAPDLATAPWLLTISYYTEEVSAIVEAMGWSRFHFFGNSWGTIIGQSYALLHDPRLQAIVLSGPLSDGQLYIQSQWDPIQGNLGSLPLYVQEVLRELGRQQAYDSNLYAALNGILTSFFTVRTTILVDCLAQALPSTTTAKDIYLKMQGPDEFSIGGVLAFANFTPRLSEIRNPVLLTHGQYDTMRPPVVDTMYRNLPRAWKEMMPRSGHASMIDDPKPMNDVVGEFLDRSELGTLDGFRKQPQAFSDATPSALDVQTLSSTSAWPLASAAALLGAAVGVVVGSVVTTLAQSDNPSCKHRLSGLQSPFIA